MMERRPDGSRPLWECRLVDGLEDGRWALIVKIHHSVAASKLLAALCDGDTGDEAHPQIPRPPAGMLVPACPTSTR